MKSILSPEELSTSIGGSLPSGAQNGAAPPSKPAPGEGAAALSHQELHLRTIFHAAFEFIGVFRPDGAIVDANQTALDYFALTRDEIEGQPVWEVMRPAFAHEGVARLRAAVQQAAEGHFVRYEETVLSAGNEAITLDLSIKPIYDEQGRVALLISEGRDVTEGSRARLALEQKTALIELLQKVAVAANEATSVEEALQFAVDAVCAYTGWPVGHVYLPDPEAPHDLFPSSLWHLDDAAQFEAFRAVTESIRFKVGQGLPGKVLQTGEPAWIIDITTEASFRRGALAENLGVRAAFAFPVLAGREVGAVLEFYSDRAAEPDEALLDVMLNVGRQLGRVIERHRAAEALRASETRYRTLTDSAADAIVVADHEGRIHDWNKGAQKIFGYRPEEVVGRSLTMLMPARYAEAHERGMARVLATGETRVVGHTVELHGVRKSGAEFPLELSLAQWQAGGAVYFTGILRDITERKDGEASLLENEQRFRNLIEGVQDYAIFMLDPDGHVVSWNRGAERIKQYSEEEIVGRRFTIFYRPEDRATGKPERLLSIARAQGRSEDEGWRVRKDGSRFWANVVLTALWDEAGTLRGFSKVTRDLTERRRSEEALRASERRLTHAQRIARLGSWEWNVTTGALTWSDELYRIYGLTPGSDVSFERFSALLHPDDRARVLGIVEGAMQSQESFSYYHRIVRPDGAVRVLHAEGEVVTNAEGHVQKMAGIGHDVTEQQEAEQALRESEHRFRLLAENVTDLVCLHDARGRFLYLSPSAERILGYPPEQLLGADPRELIHPDDVNRVLDAVRRQLRDGDGFAELTVRIRTRGGAYLWLETTIKPILDKHGGPARLQTSSRDVTERIQARQTLAHMNVALEQRNRELQDFAYVASHDLQEPLRKIRAFADLMREDYRGRLDEMGTFYLQRMQESAERMSQLISDLLAYSRVTTRTRPFERVDLGSLATEVLTDLEFMVRDTGGRVEVDALPTVEAEASQMRQLLQNLIANSLKFAREGVPPVVQVRGHEKQRVDETGAQTVCFLEVQDNGIGFDEKYLDRIFTPFQRLHGNEAYAGTGMGLAICRRIVERHGGTLTARSTPGHGATFVVAIPVTQPRREVTEAPATEPGSVP